MSAHSAVFSFSGHNYGLGESVVNGITASLLAGHGQMAQRACVLSGSMGAPAALRRFFQSFDAVPPVVFIVLLPVSPDAIPLVCDFIARNTSMRVLPALSGHVFSHGEIVVVPSNRKFTIDDNSIQLVNRMDDACNPIDETMVSLSRYFRQYLGAIIFSGLGEDGRKGCSAILKGGGEVWTQSVDSCLFGSLPRSVSEACAIKYSATPESLAVRLQSELRVIRRHQMSKVPLVTA